MMNGNAFEAHGIQHLSPSSLNLFAAAPAVWVMERLLKRSAPVGSAAHRGTAVEAGVAHGLMEGADDAACVEVAATKYGVLTALSGDHRREDNGKDVAGMVVQGLRELRPYGPPDRCQGRIEYQVDGLPVPIMGFFDFAWDRHGIILDLKSTGALPSSIKPSHARQVALYMTGSAANSDPRITYATTKRVATYRLEEVRRHLAALEKIGHALHRFLAVSRDKHELAGILIPDVEHFYLANPVARQHAFEVYGV